jgi:hypothetical protein
LKLTLGRILPWRLRKLAHKWYLEFLRRKYDRLVDSTPSYISNKDTADFEIHSLLGSRHVGMCLWSIKSFLHHSGRRFSVVLHDDGTLTRSDIKKLEHHLTGVQVIDKATADREIADKISPYSNVYAYRFGQLGKTQWGKKMSVFALKLLDFNLLTNASKILVLDTDVLFFRQPDEIINWADRGTGVGCRYCYEDYLPIFDDLGEIIRFQKKSTPSCYFNSGVICFDKAALDLSILDKWLGDNQELVDSVYILEQKAYNILVHNAPSHEPLPISYSFNYNDLNCIATHFGIKILFFQNLKRVLNALSGPVA